MNRSVVSFVKSKTKCAPEKNKLTASKLATERFEAGATMGEIEESLKKKDFCRKTIWNAMGSKPGRTRPDVANRKKRRPYKNKDMIKQHVHH